jgi:26S proteasome regulatory subunit N2
MALGISCAGTGLRDAIDLLEPMLKDPVDFVRQGSMIALAMILIQQNEKMNPKIKKVHQDFAKVVSAKHEDAMAKFGAALAQGIIDAGGRNVTIALEHSQTDNLNMRAVVGLAVFVQFWYWFPVAHFLSLAFTPTTIVGVREDLKIPYMDLNCDVNPKLFGYPPKIQEESEKAPEKLVTAILSTTMRAKSRAKKTSDAKKRAKQEESGIEIDEQSDNEKQAERNTKDEKSGENEKMDVDAHSENDIDDKTGKKIYKIDNMSRVLPNQLKYISFPSSGRYYPIREFHGVGGVVVVKDKSPGQPVEFFKTIRQVNSQGDDEEDEAPLPAPFTYRKQTETKT